MRISRLRFVKKACTTLAAMSLLPRLKLKAADRFGSWISLFNGKDLTGWEGVNGTSTNWTVNNGLLINTGRKKGNASWIAHERVFANFELELEFQFEAGCNSGVFFRTPLVKKSPAYLGNEIQIADMMDPQLQKTLSHDRHMGALYTVSPPLRNVAAKPTEWQRMRIVCNAEHCQVTLNDQLVQEVQLNQFPNEVTKEHPGLLNPRGHIGLQSKETPIKFRNLRIREIL